MNILIVDDEYYIVQGILKNTNWKTLGIENTYTAYSMHQAINVLKANDIHILLTDIAMPKGSGLELIEWVNAEGYNIVKLLLTGHENFSYAKEAIRLGCSEYIVKPVQTQRLEEALSSALAKAKSDQHSALARELANSWNTTEQLKYSRFWSELFNGELTSDTSIHNAIIRYNLEPSWLEERFSYILVHHYPNHDQSASIFRPETLRKRLDSDRSFIEKIDANNYLIISFKEVNIDDNVLLHLNKEYPKDLFTVFYTEPLLLNESKVFYNKALRIIDTYFSVANLLVSLPLEESAEVVSPSYRSLNLDVWPRLLIENKTQHIKNEIISLFIRKSVLYPRSSLKLIYHGVLHAVMQALESTGKESTVYYKYLQDSQLQENVENSLDHLIFWIDDLFKEVSDLLHESSEQDIFLTKVKNHIAVHLASNDLSRNSIAEEIHMNPDYISYLFHKISGQHLSTYISKKRIDEAKKLLLTTSVSLQQIANQTGFSNASYFHRQFKKVTGITPQQFRKRNQTIGGGSNEHKNETSIGK